MKKIVWVLALLLGVANVVNAQVHTNREVKIPSKIFNLVNITMNRHSAHLDTAIIIEHIDDGQFTSITGDFMVSCSGGRHVHVEGVVPAQAFLTDTMRTLLRNNGYRPMSIDESIADMMGGDMKSQISSIRLVLSVLEGACITPIENVHPALYTAFSLWSGIDSNMPAVVKITERKFLELAK